MHRQLGILCAKLLIRFYTSLFETSFYLVDARIYTGHIEIFTYKIIIVDSELQHRLRVGDMCKGTEASKI